MTITVGISHHTQYKYDRSVNMGPHIFRLRPAPHSRTKIKSYSLKIVPEDHYINWQQDPFGNYQARVVFNKPTTEFSFTVDLVAELTVINPFDFFLEDYAENFPFVYDAISKSELSPYLKKRKASPKFKELIKSLNPKEPLRSVDFLVAVNQAIYELVGYGIRLEPGVQTPNETISKKTGSCRDSAWLLVQLFRHLGLASRFVSGYLVQLTSDQKSLDGPSGPEEDFTDLHAWTEVYIPGAGWIGLDPTSGLFAGEGHIPLACTPEPSSAAPVTGGIDDCKSEFSFYNKVTRVHEDPRVTKPYSEAQWAAINRLGQHVDNVYNEENIHLTMGGEPTFISIDDMEHPQWNTDADGKEKRILAQNLFVEMNKVYTKGGFTHYGQGKWYPGEPLPRWQYACYWRKDGEPLWQDAALLADPNKDYKFDHTDTKKFADKLCDSLGLETKALTTAYEDILYHMWQEASLPTEIKPDQPELLHAMSRKGFLAKMDKGIEKPVGYVLPLKWNDSKNCWQSCTWEFKRGHCFLLPGESPLGYRLPLDSLEWSGNIIDRDPFDIPENFTKAKKLKKGFIGKEMVKTALVMEVREGRLYIFMPPTSHFEHYMGLISSIESVAKELKMPLVIEGYSPPKDSRVEKYAVTPDPGVIEVNIHPSTSWDQLVSRTTTLYGLAKECRLGTDKFMADGRHTGTGGGNHVTLGGETPEQSPFLRRPDILRSFITYWQHHPGLSYLFSGLFIGPTSQAPRVDEARDEVLYELEIAFSHMPEGEVPEPWLVDRLLRNLLVDLTGNTHRAEFCIDKLYSPDSATGRLGIVEFRGFEMPPHSQMSLVQMLLLRTLLAWFWKKPYHKPLIRWGTELHDKFLLPQYVENDLAEVSRDLQQAGFQFQLSWLNPFFEFRFPVCGTRELDNVTLELRTAIEPWHVLGEEASASGTARYVDSSLERVQIKVQGTMSDRYVVTCNGRRVPLKPVKGKAKDEMVAGIRYRAWQPPTALHPTIGVHAPLVFDLIDTWEGRSVGGFVYHVSHAGGRNPETLPVNAFEAEGRRVARFWEHGHTPSLLASAEPSWSPSAVTHSFQSAQSASEYVVPDEESSNPDYPNTLDLRRQPNFK
ncbi:transglutaminase family protein [Pseudoalteromonas sp. SR45-1]|uniref:transglutaminase family protein n=1 Tax=unclassified Pseudoalteromonas TaxID=194690 RepID=UPI0015FEC40F|nr:MULTISPECIES: transglutaminase family protein [unclassified Pseudoalteromonas]MBB1279595.1 transglutaminase family protein [Pseudoalteromonas sp. SR41-1]MBB1324907.1 transglutaminase family protein [Pseudoalteromonas sp. SR45-1]